MDKVITEKDYPVQKIWAFVTLSPYIIYTVVISILNYLLFSYIVDTTNKGVALTINDIPSIWLGLIMIFSPSLSLIILVVIIPIVVIILQRSNFHYSVDEYFLVLHQGIISKENRNVPYGRIQGVFVNQDLFDRIFGLASLIIEDFSSGGTSTNIYYRPRPVAIGFSGNRIDIHGLKKADAEALKAIILQKIKENPIEDSGSGL